MVVHPMKFMNLRALLLLLVLTCAATAAEEKSNTTPPGLAVVTAGRASAVDEVKAHTITFWLHQLMLSALYRTAVQEGSTADWELGVAASQRIQYRYATPVTLAWPERQVLVFDEVLLPLPTQRYPDYIYVRRGDRVLRLAKYDPWVLHKLVSEAGFPVYPSLANLERGLF